MIRRDNTALVRWIAMLCVFVMVVFALTGCGPGKTVEEIFTNLCTVPEASFKRQWARAMKTVESKGLQADWDALTSTASAYMDYLEMPELMDVCSLSKPEHIDTSSPYFKTVRAPIIKGLSPWFKEVIYKPGQFLDLSGTVWTPEQLEAFSKGREHLDRQEGDPIRILVMDTSRKIANKTSGIVDMFFTNGQLKSVLHDDISSRAKAIWDKLFHDIDKGRLLWTPYPEQADVQLAIEVSYPSAGRYSGQGAGANVCGCKVVLTMTNRITSEKSSQTFTNMPESSVRTTVGSTIVWMDLPDIEKNPKATAMTDELLRWFSDAQTVS